MPSLLALCAGLILSISTASARVTVGDNLDLFVTADVQGRCQSNVFLASSNKQNDRNLTVSPGVEARYGQDSRAGLDFVFREDIYFYDKYTELNSQNANVFLNGFYEGNKISFNGSFSFVQTTQNTVNVLMPNIGPNGQFATLLQQALVNQNNWAAEVHAKYDVSAKSYLEGGPKFNATQYTKTFKNIYNDQYVYAVTLNAYYRYTQTVDIGLGYRFSYTNVSNVNPFGQSIEFQPADRYENAFYLTMVGRPAAKLRTRVLAGIANQQIESGSLYAKATGFRNDTIFAFNGEVMWLTTEKLNFVLSFMRDFVTGANGQSMINIGATAGARYAYSDKVSFEAGVQWVNSNYQTEFNAMEAQADLDDNFIGRVDNTANVKIGAKLIPYEWLHIGVSYTYQYNQSTKAYARYANNTFQLTAGVKF